MQRSIKNSERYSRIKEAIQTSDKTTTWANKKSEKQIPKVAILCRVSSLKQEKDGTIEQQRYTCQKLYQDHFESQAHEFVGEYADENYNLESKDTKRNFWKLMEAIRLGEVNTVITVNIDRIFRGATKQLNGEISDIFTLAKLVLITTSQKKQYDPTDITSRMVDGFLQELG
ncbi:MAG: recombinase family protein, partial [Pseudobdellovibrionaceae bacterium]|nr:recombinase family protein [Pseudobdellovibrionaceae bacterium]